MLFEKKFSWSSWSRRFQRDLKIGITIGKTHFFLKTYACPLLGHALLKANTVKSIFCTKKWRPMFACQYHRESIDQPVKERMKGQIFGLNFCFNHAITPTVLLTGICGKWWHNTCRNKQWAKHWRKEKKKTFVDRKRKYWQKEKEVRRPLSSHM